MENKKSILKKRYSKQKVSIKHSLNMRNEVARKAAARKIEAVILKRGTKTAANMMAIRVNAAWLHGNAAVDSLSSA